MEKNSSIQVGAAIIRQNNYILLSRRHSWAHMGGFWEFPGGKCKTEESLENCVIREVMEELDIYLQDLHFVMCCSYAYPEKTIELSVFECKSFRGMPKAIGCVNFQWIRNEDLNIYQFPPANAPILRHLLTENPFS